MHVNALRSSLLILLAIDTSILTEVVITVIIAGLQILIEM